MKARRVWMHSASLITVFGAGLFLLAATQHITEFLSLDGSIGPIVAFALDGLLALGVGYGGHRLSQTELSPADRRQVLIWSLGGALIFAAAIVATFLVRMIEGRVIAEPLFPLLVAVEAGAIAGLVAGYYSARSRADADRAQAVTDALSFVNSLIRHDLRNDLSVIQGRAELLKTQASSTDAGSERDSSVIIVEKVDEAMTRIETTRGITDTLVGDPGLEPTDLVPIVAELATRCEATHDVAVTIDLSERALVAANVGLRSVVDNLLENAVEHNDADEPRVAVTVETDGDTTRVTVSDNGPGLPPGLQQALNNAERTELGGRGLTLVQTLIEAYDGTIRVEDNDPRGSRFIVALPQAEQQP